MKSTEAGHVTELPMNGGQERTLLGAMKVNPGLCWRPQNFRNARAIDCILSMINFTQGMKSAQEKENYVAINKPGREKPS